MRVSKWILKHRPSPGDAMVASFNLPQNPQAQRKWALEVRAKYFPDQDDERCLVITDIKSTDLQEMKTWQNGAFAQYDEMRHRYEVQSIRADPDVYGTGLVLLNVANIADVLFSRGIPISFDREMASEIPPARIAVWQEELLRKTGCIELIEAGHARCEHQH